MIYVKTTSGKGFSRLAFSVISHLTLINPLKRLTDKRFSQHGLKASSVLKSIQTGINAKTAIKSSTIFLCTSLHNLHNTPEGNEPVSPFFKRTTAHFRRM